MFAAMYCLLSALNRLMRSVKVTLLAALAAVLTAVGAAILVMDICTFLSFLYGLHSSATVWAAEWDVIAVH